MWAEQVGRSEEEKLVDVLNVDRKEEEANQVRHGGIISRHVGII